MATKDLTKTAVKAGKGPEGKPIDTRKRIEMYATAAHPFLKAGAVTMITTVQAELQEKRGFLAKTKEEALATVPADFLDESLDEELGGEAPTDKTDKSKKADGKKGGADLA